jgi:hypothetical protein
MFLKVLEMYTFSIPRKNFIVVHHSDKMMDYDVSSARAEILKRIFSLSYRGEMVESNEFFSS